MCGYVREGKSVSIVFSDDCEYSSLMCSVTKLCPTRRDPVDCHPPARTLEWVAVSSPCDLPAAGIEPGSPALQADLSGNFLHVEFNVECKTLSVDF